MGNPFLEKELNDIITKLENCHTFINKQDSKLEAEYILQRLTQIESLTSQIKLLYLLKLIKKE